MNGTARFLLTAGCLAGQFWPGPSRGEESQHPGGQATMMTLAKSMLGIQRGLAAGDTAGVMAQAKALQQAVKGLADLEPERNGDLVAGFDGYRSDIARLTADLVTAATRRDTAEIAPIAGEIRHTCVSCHVKFRRKTDDNGLFPNIGNLVAGQVELVKQDGEERTDRSNVVVFLERGGGGADFPPPRKRPVISQKEQSFVPRVLPVMKGTTVDFPNDDTIFHNVFSLSKARPLDLGIYRPKEKRSLDFPAPGWVRIYCNIHPTMVAHLLILENPFFSLTDERGLFVIPEVPDGAYVLRTWHEFGGEVRQAIEVAGSTLSSYDLEIREDRRLVQHKGKFGQPYKEKY
jgi:cytochrome c556